MRLAELIRRDVLALDLPHAAAAPRLSVSIGIAVADPNVDKNPTDLVAAADAALYRSKRNGRNVSTLAGATASQPERDRLAG